jgi:hypothetical protein
MYCICLSVCLSTYLSTYLFCLYIQATYQSYYLSLYISLYLYIICLSVLSIYPVNLSNFRFSFLSICPSFLFYPSFSIHLSFHLCIYLSICLSLCPFYLFLYSSIKMKHFRDTSCKKLKLKPRTRSNSARLPARMEVETVEMQKTYQASYKNAS